MFLFMFIFIFIPPLQKVTNETGTYGPDLFTRVAVERIRRHDPNQPMFMYVSQQAVHSANVDEPLQAPAHLVRVRETSTQPYV